MTYGYGKDICMGYLNSDGTFMDYKAPWYTLMPNMKPGKYADGDDKWDLMEDFYLRVGKRVFYIKFLFDFDGASIPKAFWAIIGHPMQMWVLLAALIHDALYASHRLSRSDADNLFLEIMQATGTSWAKRNACWSAVRSAGWAVYPKTEAELERYRELVDVIDLKS